MLYIYIFKGYEGDVIGSDFFGCLAEGYIADEFVYLRGC